MKRWCGMRRGARDAESPLARAGTWQLEIVDGGALWVRPSGPTLGPDELADVITQIAAQPDLGRLSQVTVDLSRITCLGPQPTVVVALLIKLARLVHGHILLLAAQGDAASVLAFYCRGPTQSRFLGRAG